MSHVGQDSHPGPQKLAGEASPVPLRSTNPPCTERGVTRRFATTVLCSRGSVYRGKGALI